MEFCEIKLDDSFISKKKKQEAAIQVVVKDESTAYGPQGCLRIITYEANCTSSKCK